MTGYVTDWRGTRWTLPNLLSWRLEYTAGVPCDSFWLRCSWQAGNEASPTDWVTFTAKHDGERVFTGVVDECEVSLSQDGCLLEVSGREGRGVEEVRELLAGRTTLVSGNSGVGKSTLIQAIDPSLDIRTGEISESHHKGRHTTTFSTMYPLAGGGAVIDTPGIKGFGLIDIDEAELWHYFPEMMRVAPACRFYNCTHTHEPGCAVTEAVKAGEIAWPRYESYLKIRDEDEKYRK